MPEFEVYEYPTCYEVYEYPMCCACALSAPCSLTGFSGSGNWKQISNPDDACGVGLYIGCAKWSVVRMPGADMQVAFVCSPFHGCCDMGACACRRQFFVMGTHL